METDDIRKIWKEGSKMMPPVELISSEEIRSFRHSRTRELFSDVRKMIWIAFTVKSVIVMALILLGAVTLGAEGVIFSLASLAIILFALMIFEISQVRRVAEIENYSKPLSGRIEELYRFFNVNWPLFQVLSSFSNPVLVLTGMFYYLWFKYSRIGPADTTDLIVTVTILIVSYMVGLVSTSIGGRQFKSGVEELMRADEEDRELYTGMVAGIRRQKIRRIIVSSLLIILGITLFILIITL